MTMRPRALVLTALLTSLALAFNIAEGLLPLPLPGVKLGAANVFALVALVLMGPRSAFSVTLLRVLLAWLVSANWFAFLCSLAGGLLATAVMVFVYVNYKSEFSLPWVSVAGAWAFNAGQVAVVALMVRDARMLFYAAPLLLIGTGTGWVVGKLAEMLCQRVKKIERMDYR